MYVPDWMGWFFLIFLGICVSVLLIYKVCYWWADFKACCEEENWKKMLVEEEEKRQKEKRAVTL